MLDGFEEKRQNVSGFYFFHAHTVIDLLAHARALEEMLRKHEWSAVVWGVQGCPSCMMQIQNGHSEDCALAKLLE